MTGDATWEGASAKPWTLRFFWNTMTHRAWGCTAGPLRRCIVDGTGSFDGTTFKADLVSKVTAQVNKYKLKVGECSSGSVPCPGEERDVEGTIRCEVAGEAEDGSVVGVVGANGQVSDSFSEDYAPTVMREA